MLNPLYLQRIEHVLTTHLQNQNICSDPLKKAMEYSVLAASKRIRPLLVYATGELTGAPLENLDIAACAIELIHTYSLIHDDLPSMDNADLRRGKPSCHKVFGEAMAILAGDALQTMAFQVMASFPEPKLNLQQRINMLEILSRASGPQGMIAGQALDIAQEVTSLEQLTRLNTLKTGKLINASIQLGIAASHLHNEGIQKALTVYGHAIGQAFQIQDDILDIEGQTQLTGKLTQIDAQHQKHTYPALMGLAAAKQEVKRLHEQACTALQAYHTQAQLLFSIADFLLKRQY